MKYHVLFGTDGKSIQFQGEGVGIVNPADILANGRIVKSETTTEIVNKGKDSEFTYIHDRDIVFIPD